jgi:hypothetical protein
LQHPETPYPKQDAQRITYTYSRIVTVSDVFPEAFLAVLAAEPDVSVGDCAMASMLPRITTQTT